MLIVQREQEVKELDGDSSANEISMSVTIKKEAQRE